MSEVVPGDDIRRETGSFLRRRPGLSAALPMAGPLFIVRTRECSGCVDMQGVEARGELRLQCIIHGPVFRQPGEAAESRRPDFHSVMRLAAGSCASMTVVQM